MTTMERKMAAQKEFEALGYRRPGGEPQVGVNWAEWALASYFAALFGGIGGAAAHLYILIARM
jgi:hypothetical protein